MTQNLHRLGQYKIEGEVGRGAFGAVYRVSLAKGKDKRFYAGKLYHCAQASDTLSDEVRLEYDVTRMWDHPHLVKSRDLGTVKIGESYYPFLIMDWIDGVSLDRCALPMPFGEAMDVVFDVAYGLAQAARAGTAKGIMLSHRDVKPGNILVRNEDARRAVVVDFGLVRLLNSEWYQKSIQPPGSASYCSPHQYSYANAADQGDDIFSLGCVLYFLLCGKHAYWIDPKTQGTVGALREIVTNRGHKPLGEIVREIPPDIGRLVERMIDCDPKTGHRNFSTWDAFLEEATLLLQYCRRHKANVLYPGGLERLRISEYQTLFHRIYSQINSTRSAEQIMLRLAACAGHLSELLQGIDGRIGTDRFADMRSELASLFVWLLELANHAGISLEPTIWLKYPGVCTYCHAKHIDQQTADSCKAQPRPIRPPGMLRLAENGLDTRPKTMREWEEMFAGIYPLTFKQGWPFLIEKLTEEIGEVADAITRPNRRLTWLRNHRVDPLAFEMADLFAWICHCSHYVGTLVPANGGSAVASEIASQYHNEVCRNCKGAPCTCDPERSSRHSRGLHVADAASTVS